MKPSDYLKKGWCQGEMIQYADDDEPVAWCIFGAGAATLQPNTYIEYKERLNELLGDAAIWNDCVGRRQAEVVAIAERIEREMGL
jgi:hypothetical protein